VKKKVSSRIVFMAKGRGGGGGVGGAGRLAGISCRWLVFDGEEEAWFADSNRADYSPINFAGASAAMWALSIGSWMRILSNLLTARDLKRIEK